MNVEDGVAGGGRRSIGVSVAREIGGVDAFCRVRIDLHSSSDNAIIIIMTTMDASFNGVPAPSSQAADWPRFLSKAALNAYTRVLAKKYRNIVINAVSPGHIKTDINQNTGTLTVEHGAKWPVRLALLPHGGPSGLFYD
ncbi:hypothetical protein TEA_029175 [Camellia sinensis var. sinensis]|uniref:Uncharacterized protein n=1 Tax=Camellia sinensis var. sinensis TaxID=542762 RepID=A0A4S4D554_CAMSN|nr:hypothetical protein TEA_029175 [Camellia sinensis var. sinensis]